MEAFNPKNTFPNVKHEVVASCCEDVLLEKVLVHMRNEDYLATSTWTHLGLLAGQ